MHRLVFDLLSMTSENKQLIDMTKLFLSMLNNNDEQTIKLIHEKILVPKDKLGKDERTFFEALIATFEKEVRDLN